MGLEIEGILVVQTDEAEEIPSIFEARDEPKSRAKSQVELPDHHFTEPPAKLPSLYLFNLAKTRFKMVSWPVDGSLNPSGLC